MSAPTLAALLASQFLHTAPAYNTEAAQTRPSSAETPARPMIPSAPPAPATDATGATGASEAAPPTEVQIIEDDGGTVAQATGSNGHLPTTSAPGASPPAVDDTSPPAISGADPQDILVTGRRGLTPGDPLERLNEKSFAAAQAVDEAFLGPVAMAYAKNVPDPVRSGLRNFRYNLHEPVVFVNFLLQHKAGKAVETLGRFAINSTLGAAGLFDVAKRKPFKLPRRRNGFANTMGFYGIKPGPYFFLPLIGPTTARDLVGNVLDQTLLPLSFIRQLRSPAYSISARTLTVLDHRAEFDEQLQNVRAAGNPYAARREIYLAKRQAEIDGLRGRTEGRRVLGEDETSGEMPGGTAGRPPASPPPSRTGRGVQTDPGGTAYLPAVDPGRAVMASPAPLP